MDHETPSKKPFSALKPDGLRLRSGQERQAHAATVVGVVVAGVLASIVVPGPYDFGSTMIGLTLLAVLFSYGEAPRSAREAVGFSAAVGISMLLAIGVFLDRLVNVSGWPTPAAEAERLKLDEVTPWWTNGIAGLIAWGVIGLLTFGLWFAWSRRDSTRSESG